MVATRGPDIFFQQSSERTHIRDDFPDLIVGNFAAESGHAVRAAFDDRLVNVFRVAAIDPFFVHERWSHTATSVRVAADAVVPVVKSLAF